MKRNVDALTDGTFDLLVLGGGITGAGVALDAVLRGLRVALIDKGDFASGTSSASSKLAHGGLRYLEHAEFALVYEALRERGLLLHNAPHLVKPLRFILPFYRGARVPPWQWRVALTMYDLLAGRGNIRRSRPLTLTHLHEDVPSLTVDGLCGGAEYYDALMDDARVCLEVLRTAAREGAHVANYVEAIAFEMSAGTIRGVRAVDRVGGREMLVRARVVLNATGPWVDALSRMAGDTSGPRLQPTKGVHIVVPDQGMSAAFLLLHPADGRVMFVIPWMGKTLIGTTDTFTPAGPDEMSVLPEEVTHLLDAYNRFFTRHLSTDDVLGSFAGLRPLIRARPGQPSSLSREFRLFSSPAGLLSVAGGKYTTYRSMAQHITDEVLRRLGRRRWCETACYRLDGAPHESWQQFAGTTVTALCQQHSLTPETARHLVHRYGRRARDVAGYLTTPEARQPVLAGEPDMYGEFAYQREHEMAIYPADHLLRRTRLGLFAGRAKLPERI
jgi:glycerol-3-phosphate dehydrogenase